MRNRYSGVPEKRHLKEPSAPSINIPFINADNDTPWSERHWKRNILQNAFDRLKCLSPKKTSSELSNPEDTTIFSINNHKKENAEHSENCKNCNNLQKEIHDLKVQLIEVQNMLDCFKKQKKSKWENIYEKD